MKPQRPERMYRWRSAAAQHTQSETQQEVGRRHGRSCQWTVSRDLRLEIRSSGHWLRAFHPAPRDMFQTMEVTYSLLYVRPLLYIYSRTAKSKLLMII